MGQGRGKGILITAEEKYRTSDGETRRHLLFGMHQVVGEGDAVGKSRSNVGMSVVKDSGEEHSLVI